MKFFFSKTDSLYKIFKTLEKIPTGRNVEIFIDSEHTLFDNPWRVKKIKDLLEKRHLDATFITKRVKNKEYFQSV
jgi:hypothetical protein